VNEHLRMSDAEREQAAGELGEHYVQGRLTAEEHSERLDQIWAARTRAELTPIFQDLPGRYAPQPFGPPFPPRFAGYAAPPRRRTRLPAPLMAILAFLVVVTVLTHLPIILFGLVVWFILAKHHRPVRHRRW
jgi:uncharacterized protein DUF1707